MNVLLPAVRLVTCSLWGVRLRIRRQKFLGYCLPRIGGGSQSVKASDVAVKESRELGFGQRADAGSLDVAVLEQHQRRNAAAAEFRRRLLVIVDVDLGDLQAVF